MSGSGVVIDPLVRFAKEAIAAKAAEKASVLGTEIGGNELIELPNTNRGVRQRFQGGIVYFTLETGAHEVHGEIGAKYQLLGPTWSGESVNLSLTPLGYPVSDEKGAHDGRVSDFEHGSIYWHPRTGPMAIHEVLIPAYQAAGLEAGGLGFPTRDTRAWRIDPMQKSRSLAWSLFENGCIASAPTGPPLTCGPGNTATISAGDLKTMIRHIADKKIHAKDINVGLEAQVDIVNVSDWQHDVDASGQRMIAYRLHAFKDNGLLLPDAKITILMTIQFNWKPELTFLDPAVQTLEARFPQFPNVDNPGVESVSEVGIPIAFGSQDFGVGDSIDVASIPVDLPGVQPAVRIILDIAVTPAGDLQFFTNPLGLLGTGGDFGPVVQQQLDQQVAAFLAS
jgi:hypothetical protein